MIRYGWQIGKTGFTPVNKTPQQAINIGDLSLNLDRLLEEGNAKQTGDRIEVNLTQIGYTKLLGNGNVNQPMRVIVAKCSETAAEKISGAGGEVVLPEAPKAVEASREG